MTVIPAIGFSHISYSDSATEADIAQRGYAYMGLQYGGNPVGSMSDKTLIQACVAAGLSTQFSAYKSAFEKAGDVGYTAFTTPTQNAANPGWYLYDSTGAKFSWGGVPQMDIGHPGYQAQALSDTVAQAQANGYGLVFMDNVLPAPIADGNYTVHLPGTLGTLTSPLTTGSPITSLPVTTPSLAIQNGTRFTLDDGAGHTQVWTATGVASGGNVPVQSQTPSFAFPATTTTLNSSISSDAYFQAAMTSFLTALSAGLHTNGLKLIGNISGINHVAVAQAYAAAGVDVWFEESLGMGFSTTSTLNPLTQTQVNNALGNLAWCEANSKSAIVHAYAQGSDSANEYSLALTLLVANNHTSYLVDSGVDGGSHLSSPYVNNATPPWRAYYDTARALGQPTGAYFVSGGVYMRGFQYGYVLANPTAVSLVEPTTGTTLAERTGLVVLTAPTGSSLGLGRLSIGPALQWQEGAGDQIGNVGGAVVAGQRAPLQSQITIATIAPDGSSDTQADRLRIRRQLRSLWNNSVLKLQRFLYVLYPDDPEQNGWYATAQANVQDLEGASGLATGFWQLQSAWSRIGHRRTHREARKVWMKDLRTGSYDRDTLGFVRGADFSALPATALSVLPNGASGGLLGASGQAVAGTPLTAGRDGGTAQLIAGLSDMQVVGYERPEAAMNLSDVICYDRRGDITAPTAGPNGGWEEAYGPDYPWNWLTVGQPLDTPVLDNGLVRVRWDLANTPGFAVDAWNGTAYVEQGKMLVQRIGDSTGYDDTLRSAGIHTDTVNGGYTPDRCVVSAVLARSADSFSQERVFVTVQRGEMRVRFEAYPALTSSGAQADAALVWCPSLDSGAADPNISVLKADSQTVPAPLASVVLVATAGSGSNLLPSTNPVGAASFASSANWAAILRCQADYKTAGGFQATLVPIQAANNKLVCGNDTSAYGVSDSTIAITSINANGYVSVGLCFTPATVSQVKEAELIRNGASGTTAVVTDATASGGQAVSDTQTAATTTTVTVNFGTALIQGRYRMLARVKVDSGVTGKFRGGVQTAAVGTIVTVTSTAWTWVDLGSFLPTAASEGFFVSAWASAGAGAVYIDRLELFLISDSTRAGALFQGSADYGQAALMQSRMLGTLVAR